MDTTQVTDLLRDAVGVALKLASPMLLLSMLVGVVVAVLLVAGGWMMDTLQDYTREIFSLIAS